MSIWLSSVHITAVSLSPEKAVRSPGNGLMGGWVGGPERGDRDKIQIIYCALTCLVVFPVPEAHFSQFPRVTSADKTLPHASYLSISSFVKLVQNA